MEGKPYLVFDWHGLQYGIEVSIVQEMFLLPELTSIVEAPRDIVGILNLRSQIVPVMHLDLRLGLQMHECTINDSVVVIAWEGLQFGIITNSIDKVEAIAPEAIEPEIDYGRVGEVNTAFLSGIATVDGNTILLLNSEALVRYPEAVEALVADVSDSEIGASQNGSGTANRSGAELNLTTLRSFEELSKSGRTPCDFYQLCCPNATPRDRQIFQKRAEELKQATEASDAAAEKMPFAAIAIGGEYYGLDLQLVREFIDVGKITPIPCCPNHITGNINLRGEIVTLVDIRQVLNLPLANAANISKAIVVEIDDLVAGLPVDEVFDVEYFRSSDVKAVPTAIASGGEAFVRGTVAYSDKLLSILDLPKMLAEGDLEVNEEI